MSSFNDLFSTKVDVSEFVTPAEKDTLIDNAVPFVITKVRKVSVTGDPAYQYTVIYDPKYAEITKDMGTVMTFGAKPSKDGVNSPRTEQAEKMIEHLKTHQSTPVCKLGLRRMRSGQYTKVFMDIDDESEKTTATSEPISEDSLPF